MFVSTPEVKYFKIGLPNYVIFSTEFESCQVFKSVTWERKNVELQNVTNSGEGRERIVNRQDIL